MLHFRNILGHTFCVTLLEDRKNLRVIDGGANRGEFARHFAERVGATVVSYEADPAVAARLPTIPGVTFVNAAVTGTGGTVQIRRSPGSCSSIRFHESQPESSTQVPGVTLQQILETHGIDHVDLLKLDIEGAELDVLELTSPETLSKCAQITCEFHDFMNRDDLPRIRGILRSLGPTFFIVSLSVFNYGDVLFINRRAVQGLRWVKLQILVHKYAAGLNRLVRRALGMRA